MTQAKSQNNSIAFQIQFESNGYKFHFLVSAQAVSFAIIMIKFLSVIPNWLQAIKGIF